jgi:predicted pyridoxine 5'-phosphate oxidase superfamily flavin-nucleotide-binding protein
VPTKLEGPGPFHEGELTLQEATGEREAGAGNGRIIADRIPDNAAGFIARQELAAVATVDGEGRPWCSPLLGPAGSFTALDAGRLALRRAAARADDPLWANLTRARRVGLLFLEAARRRRYRVNGRVADPAADPLVVEIAEALGNCPRYITARHLVVDPAAEAPDGRDVLGGPDLGAAERAIIAAADTAFVASANPAGQLDASHRGGRPGFVEWRDGRLWIPDYPGNSMFMTLGNLTVHPAAGLLFIDFAGGQALQLTGATSIDLDADDAAATTGGTGRAWTFTPTTWRRAPLPAAVHAEVLERSPFNP